MGESGVAPPTPGARATHTTQQASQVEPRTYQYADAPSQDEIRPDKAAFRSESSYVRRVGSSSLSSYGERLRAWLNRSFDEMSTRREVALYAAMLGSMYGGYRVLQGRLRVNTPNSLVVRYIASFGLGTLLWVESHRFLKTSRAPVHPVPVPRVDRGGCELDVWNYNIPCGLAGGVLGIFSLKEVRRRQRFLHVPLSILVPFGAATLVWLAVDGTTRFHRYVQRRRELNKRYSQSWRDGYFKYERVLDRVRNPFFSRDDLEDELEYIDGRFRTYVPIVPPGFSLMQSDEYEEFRRSGYYRLNQPYFKRRRTPLNEEEMKYLDKKLSPNKVGKKGTLNLPF